MSPRTEPPQPAAPSGHGQGEGARLAEAPAAELIETSFRLEIGDAPILWRGLGRADLAHALMLCEVGVIPPADGCRLLALLLELDQVPLEQISLDPALEDAYSNREAWLRKRDQHVAGWMGAGRPRREPATVAYRLAVRERLLDLCRALADFATTLVDCAAANVETVTPDFTYLQHAQPTSLAHYLLSFVYPVVRDLERLRGCFARTNQSPAGIGNINGSRLPLDRRRLAELLGFDGVIVNTRDAMWQVDGPVEIMSLVVALVLNLDRLAEDLQIWNTAEFDLVELADRHARISLIMPQKKNPYSLAFVRGVTGSLLGRMVAMAAVGKTPSAQMDNRVFVIGEVPRALDQAIGAVRLMAGVLAGVTFNAPVMRRRASQGYAYATDLAEVVMQTAQTSYRSAHRLVGLAIRMAIERGDGEGKIPADILAEAGRQVLGRPVELPADVRAKLGDPAAIVATRQGIGGAAVEPVAAMLAELRHEVGSARTWEAETSARLSAAETALLRLAAARATRETIVR